LSGSQEAEGKNTLIFMLQGSHILESSTGQKKNTVNEEGGGNAGQAGSAIATHKINK